MNNPLVLCVICIFSFTQLISQNDKAFDDKYLLTQRSAPITDKVYHKETGEKLTSEEIIELTRRSPIVYFHPVIDKFGQATKFLYDPNNTKADFRVSDRNRVAQGEPFPKFVFNSIDDELIASEYIENEIIIIRFDFKPDSIRFRYDVLYELEEQIIKAAGDQAYTAILHFLDTNESVSTKLNLKDDSIFKAIGDGQWFHQKFGINSYPTTVILDRNKNVINYFKSRDEIDFAEIFKE